MRSTNRPKYAGVDSGPGDRRVMRAARLALLGGLAFVFVAVALASAARATDPPGMDGGMDPQVVLLADVRSDFNVMDAGSTLPMRVIVVDQHGVPVFGVHVEVSAAGATLVPASRLTDVGGGFRILLTEAAPPTTLTPPATVSVA